LRKLDSKAQARCKQTYFADLSELDLCFTVFPHRDNSGDTNLEKKSLSSFPLRPQNSNKHHRKGDHTETLRKADSPNSDHL